MEEETAAPAELRASGRIAGCKRSSVKADPPGIRPKDIGQAFQENRLPGSAGAKHGKYAATHHPEVDSCQDSPVSKTHVEVFDMKQEVLFGGIHDQTRNEVMM